MRTFLSILALTLVMSCASVPSDPDCPLYGIAYDDQELNSHLWLRKWTLVDWCRYDPKTGEGLWEWDQTVTAGAEAEVPRQFQRQLNSQK